MRCKGFMLGATSGRTTLMGEGLQHQDGQSHVLAHPVPNLMAYDPTFAFELAVIIRHGIQRMYEKQEDVFYYLTLGNENYAMTKMPKGVKEGILKGLYCFRSSSMKKSSAHAHLLGSGAILNEVLKAQKILEEKYKVSADVWSVTSYKELYRNACSVERWNRLHSEKKPRVPYMTECLASKKGIFVAATDYVKMLPYSVAQWIPGPFVCLGTDGFGRSDSREALRDYFEVDAKHIVLAALSSLAREGKVKVDLVSRAKKDLRIDGGYGEMA